MEASSSMMSTAGAEVPSSTEGWRLRRTLSDMDSLPIFRLHDGEFEMECRAFAGRALNVNFASVLLNNAVCDREAEACAAALAAAIGHLGGEKRIVDAGDVLGRDTAAGIGHGDFHRAGTIRGVNAECASRGHGVFGVEK